MADLAHPQQSAGRRRTNPDIPSDQRTPCAARRDRNALIRSASTQRQSGRATGHCAASCDQLRDGRIAAHGQIARYRLILGGGGGAERQRETC